MNRIDALIAELCPEGMKFESLREVASYSDTRVDAAKLDETSFVGVDNLLPGMNGKVDANYSPNTARLTAYESGDVLIGNIRPYLKKIWLADTVGGCSGDVLAVRIRPSYRNCLLPRFLYRLLASDAFFTYSMQRAKGAKMPRGSKEAILKFRIPVPPIAIQREIVKVLDTFTELEAELEARRLQHAHYRDSLFAAKCEGNLQVVMGEIGTFIRGRRFTKSDVVESGIPSIHYGEIYTHYGTTSTSTLTHVNTDLARSLRYAQPGDVVIAAVGETVEDVGKAVAWLGDSDVAIHDDCFLFRHSMNPKYVAYYLQKELFHSQKNKYVARAKVKRLSGESLAKISLPVPPLEEQDRIVAILDKFDALVNDLSIGLPAELKARRQQYEYYRDKLLTFEERAA
jgi:type I restriction enzyme, S subunit